MQAIYFTIRLTTMGHPNRRKIIESGKYEVNIN